MHYDLYKINCDIVLTIQMRTLYANINIPARKLPKCSSDIKSMLFKLICSTMWYNCTVTAVKILRIAYSNSL